VSPGALLRAALLWALAGLPVAQAQDAAALRERHAALREQLASSPFQEPLHLQSSERANSVKGDVYARIAQPYAVAGPALLGMDRWCDILILHLNIKRCRSSTPAAGDTLSLRIGRKLGQPPAEAYPFEFLYKVAVAGPDYLQVGLDAAQGPMGTRRHRIVLEIVGLDDANSFLHVSYTYGYGTVARMAMQFYLATIGYDKVGFSVVGSEADGQPIYIRSVRGVVERNAMRCYLAIEAYLGALSAPPAQQQEKRLNDWFTGVERYPAQLHELERGEYLDMKRREIRGQQASGAVAAAK